MLKLFNNSALAQRRNYGVWHAFNMKETTYKHKGYDMELYLNSWENSEKIKVNKKKIKCNIENNFIMFTIESLSFIFYRKLHYTLFSIYFISF